MIKLIYADNAATTQLSQDALEAMLPFFKAEYGNASEPYSFARSAKKALLFARKMIAQCINALPEEIYFTSGGTESDNWALKGTMFVYGDNRKLITSQIEHHAVLNSAKSIEKMGYPVVYLPVDAEGVVQSDTLERYITNRTKLVSVMLSNNEIGTVQPIKELAEIAHTYGALFHTDAVQAVGHVCIDVKELGVDMLSASAHKFNGPKGIGFLYIKKGTEIAPYSDGGAQESGKRAGTENIALIVGMATALHENNLTIRDNEVHLLKMERTLLRHLDEAGIDYIRNGSKNRIPGTLSLSFRGYEGEMLLHRLDLKGICVSTGSACDSENTRISHVLQAIGLEEEYALGTIRISLGRLNTTAEVIAIADAIISIIK
ncbi:cysteine desulfurase family protein [Clostridium sp. chh4-2]|uniref:cysteine desulfurase family protein n=1 Tax=Clostridium sp. chh4-2 TaxID=2067550 RepID=UPI001FA8B03C|nr:cysteine desulfurase family protein [Clostridium sp. chh4-2]